MSLRTHERNRHHRAALSRPAEVRQCGYTCGLAARFIDGPAEVSLRAPPPLDVVRTTDGVALRHDAKDVVIAPRALYMTKLAEYSPALKRYGSK